MELKRTATYLYTYEINLPNSEPQTDNVENVPFLFDRREQIDEKKYVVCKKCGSTFPCSVEKDNNNIHLTILQRAIRSDYKETPEYFG